MVHHMFSVSCTKYAVKGCIVSYFVRGYESPYKIQISDAGYFKSIIYGFASISLF